MVTYIRLILLRKSGSDSKSPFNPHPLDPASDPVYVVFDTWLTVDLHWPNNGSSLFIKIFLTLLRGCWNLVQVLWLELKQLPRELINISSTTCSVVHGILEIIIIVSSITVVRFRATAANLHLETGRLLLQLRLLFVRLRDYLWLRLLLFPQLFAPAFLAFKLIDQVIDIILGRLMRLLNDPLSALSKVSFIGHHSVIGLGCLFFFSLKALLHQEIEFIYFVII